MNEIKIDFTDWYCRNCCFVFVPTYWVYGAGELVGQCTKCGSNATQRVGGGKKWKTKQN